MSAAVGEARAATDLWMCNYDMHNNHFIDFPILIREALVQHSVSFADDVRCGAKGGARLDEAVKCKRIGPRRKRKVSQTWEDRRAQHNFQAPRPLLQGRWPGIEGEA